MNETERDQDALHNVLHHAVDHVYAPVDLAQRVEAVGAARRRRTARWSAAGAIALVAVGATAGVLVSVHAGALPSTSTTYATSHNQLPSCANNASAYQHPKPVGNAPAVHTATAPVVPGSPGAAVVCRYAGSGDLGGSATITDRSQLTRLQSAMNAGKAYSGAMYCMASTGTAAVVFVYPHGTANLTVIYDRGCASLYTTAGSYLVRGDVDQLIVGLTGSWQSTASPSTS
jgi:hypothetical protein